MIQQYAATGDGGAHVRRLVEEQASSLHNPLAQRRRDAAARERLNADGRLLPELRNVITTLSDELDLHEDDARAFVVNAQRYAAVRAGNDAEPFMSGATTPLQLARRLFLFQRHELLNALLELLQLRVAAELSDLQRDFVRTLTQQCVLRGDTPGVGFAAHCMNGIRSLTEQVRRTCATDAFAASAAIAARQLLARILYMLFHDVHLNIEAAGDAATGGELGGLISLIHFVSDELCRSADHTDTNPLHELLWTLLVALLRAVDPLQEKQDPSALHTSFTRCTASAARRVLIAYTSRASDAAADVDSELCRAAGLTVAQPAKWLHPGAQGAVTLALALWYFGAFLVSTAMDGAAAGDDATSTEPIVVNAVTSLFDSAGPVQQKKHERAVKHVSHLLAKCYDLRAFTFLTRCVASASFRQSPLRLSVVPLLHTSLASMLRFDVTFIPREQWMSLRTRRLRRMQREQKAAKHHQSHSTLGFALMHSSMGVPAASDAPVEMDCLEELLQLQTQLVRAQPELACTFWCAFGSAAQPYTPRVWNLYAALLSGSLAAQFLDPQLEAVSSPAASLLGVQPALLHTDDDALTVAGRRWDDLGVLNATAYVSDVCDALTSDLDDMQRRVAERQAIMDTLKQQQDAETPFTDALPDFLSMSAANSDASAAAVARTREQLGEHQRFVAMETQLSSEFCVIITDFLAALASGPLCADGRSCADHALAFMNRDYAAQRVRDVASTLVTVFNARVQAFRQLNPQVLADAGIAELMAAGEEPPAFVVGYAPVELSLAAPSRSVQDAAARVLREPSPCAPYLLLETTLSALAAAAAELDPFLHQIRQLWYDERVDERQRRMRALAERHVLPLEDAYGMGGTGAPAEVELVVPTPRIPPVAEIAAYLRLLLPLCADACTRRTVMQAHIALPLAAMDAAYAVHGLRSMYRDRISRDRSGEPLMVDSDDALPPELRQWCTQVEKPDILQAYSRASKPAAHTTLPNVLMHMLRLGAPISIKAHILRILAMCARDISSAARVRDDIEAYQILQTIPHAIPAQPRRAAPFVLGNGWSTGAASGSIMGEALPAVPLDTGMQMELDRVETAERTYDATIAFCELFRILYAAVPMHALGALQRVPGVHRHIDFVVGQVFVRSFTRAVRPDRPADAYKMAFASLGVVHDVLKDYKVVYPPVKRTPAAAAPPSSALTSLLSPSATAPQLRVEDITVGVPDSDFFADDALPRVPRARGDVRGHRSPGFQLMCVLLSGSEVTMQVFKLITCDGASILRLEADFDVYVDNTCSAAIAQRASRASSIPGDCCPPVALVDSQRAAHDEYARLKAAPLVEASVHGAGAYEDPVEWKERCLMLALSLCEAVLSKDVAFINAHRAAGMPGVLIPFAELMRREHVLPHVVAAVGYRNDVRIGVLAARVLRQVVCVAGSIVPTPVLISELQTPLRTDVAGVSGNVTLQDLVQRVGACLQDDGGTDIDEDIQAADDTSLRRNLLEMAAATLGVIDVGFLQSSMDEADPAPGASVLQSLDGTMSAVLSNSLTLRADLQRAELVKKPQDRASATAVAALLATAPVDPRHVIAVGGVQLPISADHGPLTASLTGWAAVDMTDRGALSALAERRSVLLDTVRAAMTTATASAPVASGVSSEWMPASTLAAAMSSLPRDMTLGHVLLGIPSRAFAAATGDTAFRGLVDVQSAVGVTRILDLLIPDAVRRRPTAAATCAHIVSSLLHDARLHARVLHTLQEAHAQGDEPVASQRNFLCDCLLGLEPLMRRLQRTRLQQASEIIEDDADHQVYIAAVVNAEAAVLEAARVMQLPSIVTNAIRRALALRHAFASVLEATAVQARAGATPITSQAAMLALLGESTRPAAVRDGFLLRTLLLVAAPVGEQAGAQDDVAAGASPDVAAAWTRSMPMPHRMASAIAKHAPSNAATALHNLAMSRAVMGKPQVGAGHQRGPSVVDAFGVTGRNDFGSLLSIGGVEYQLYDLDALRLLLIADMPSAEADVLGGTLASTVLNRSSAPVNDSRALFMDVDGDAPDARRVAALEAATIQRLKEVQTCLWWAQQHNAYGMQLHAMQHGAEGWAQLVTCIVDTVLPTASEMNAAPGASASMVLAAQDAQAGVLVTLLQAVVHALEEALPTSVVALPLTRLCEYLVVTLRSRCGAALPSEAQAKEIVRGLCAVCGALARPAAVGTVASMQPTATAARSCVYAAMEHMTRHVHAVPLVGGAPVLVAPAGAIEAAVSGWQAAIADAGTMLVDALVSDATSAAAREAAIAMRVLSTLLIPTSNLLDQDAAMRFGVGNIESANRLSVLPPASLENFATLRRALVQHMIMQGSIRALILTYVNVDRVEHDAVTSLDAAAVSSSVTQSSASATPGSKRLGDALHSVVDPGTGRKRVRLHTGGGMDTTRQISDADMELRSLLGESDLAALRDAYDSALSLLGCIATDALGSAALLDEGFVGALTRNCWLTRVVETTVGVRAIAAGASAAALHGIGASVPTGGEPQLGLDFSDGGVSYPLAVVAVIERRVLLLLDMLTSIMGLRTGDVALAAVVMTWTRTYYPLLDTIVQASLATPTSLGAVRLAGAFTRLLSVLASTPGGLEADSVDVSTTLAASTTTPSRSRAHGSASALLGASRADALVMRLFMKFHAQPRAAALAELAGANKRRAGMPTDAPVRPRTAWFHNIVPVTAWERSAHTTALKQPAATVFDSQVADAAEELGCAMAAYCRLRCTSALLSGRPNVGDPVSAVALFLAPEDVAADALLSTSSPSIRTLLDGLEQAALALGRARGALVDARKLRAGPDPAGHAHARELEVMALKSGRACTFMVENLLTTWYVHAVMHTRLRMDTADTEAILARPAFTPLFVGTGTGTDVLFQPDNQRFVASIRRQLLVVAADSDERR